MREIITSNGFRYIVDEEDFEYLSQFKWYSRKDGYASHGPWNGKNKLRLHIAIATRMGLDTSCTIDHKDRNTLNCRRGNLRSATRSQNQMNRGPQSNNTTGFKGVSPRDDIFIAKINNRNLGRFKTAKEAALAYNLAAKETFGDFAFLNKVEM